ncbi:hypothetical protein SPHINGO361_120725 [Sphingomonas sp. EC-HK361]|nr:hypothetical protein SPHINGO361_120725 [Sphingomonas sp. EC-HK361]
MARDAIPHPFAGKAYAPLINFV